VTIVHHSETSDMHHSRRLATIAATALLLILVAPASAHEELVESDPAAGSTLDAPPTEVVLTFSGELTAESGFVVVDDGGAEVGAGELDLDVAERNILRGDVAIAGDGTYTVDWTAVSADGHAEEGTFAFGVGADAAPNTAMPPPSVAPLAGLALMALAAGAWLVLRPARR
jgi:hypothetical protein